MLTWNDANVLKYPYNPNSELNRGCINSTFCLDNYFTEWNIFYLWDNRYTDITQVLGLSNIHLCSIFRICISVGILVLLQFISYGCFPSQLVRTSYAWNINANLKENLTFLVTRNIGDCFFIRFMDTHKCYSKECGWRTKIWLNIWSYRTYIIWRFCSCMYMEVGLKYSSEFCHENRLHAYCCFEKGEETEVLCACKSSRVLFVLWIHAIEGIGKSFVLFSLPACLFY